MNDNTNRDAVLNAIWENPARIFGGEFRQSNGYWEYVRGGEYHERGKIRLQHVHGGPRINVWYNGDTRPQKCDVIDYLEQYVLNTAGFRNTLERAAEVYGITLNFTAEQRQAMNRATLAREVAPSLIEALRSNPSGDAAQYLRDVRGLSIDEHFGELSEQSIQRAVEGLKMRGKSYDAADFEALGLTAARANAGYKLVLPYYRNGAVVGFLFRDVTGKANPKYLFSAGLSRGGYCDRLTTGEPAVFAEGEIDAIRLMQAGIKNVVAMGTAQLTEQTAALLRSRGIEQITYVPDAEVDAELRPDTGLIARAVEKFMAARVDGEPVVKSLYVAELPPPDDWAKYPKYKDGVLKGYKIDADTYGKDHGGEALAAVVDLNAAPSWAWELAELLKWAAEKDKADGSVNIAAFQSRFDAIYNRYPNVYERERIKQHVDSKDNRPVFRAFGVTPQALNDRDEWNRNKEYNNRIKAAAADLAKAVENEANPAVVADIVAKLADVQSTNTRDEWDKQINETFDDELAAIANQPDALRTKWVLGNVDKAGKFYKYETVEFWPADITVFCAPTSHGKTMILFQSALDMVREHTDETFLFVSCEENKRQLVERALNVYLDIENTDNGKTSTGAYCFVKGTRKRSIKTILRNAPAPQEYNPYMGRSEHFDALAAQVRQGVAKYGREVRPRLKFVHTDATVESITANILHTVDDLREQGATVGGVFVDYMQLLTSDVKSFSRHDELKDVCKALKSCAARLEIPVVIAAQLNRQVLAEGIDAVTVANIGEGADIERIAHDIYFVWQVDKTKKDRYFTTAEDKKGGGAITKWNYAAAGDRANRIFTQGTPEYPNARELKKGYIYIEQMKARDGKTDGWGLLSYVGERGYIGENDTVKMAE